MKKIKYMRKIIFLPHLLLNISLLICLFMAPWIVLAAGLGKLTVGSYLGQPFKAEVELVAIKESDIPTLTAKLASPEAFRQAGLKYLDYHAGLSVTVARRVDGRPYLQMASSQSINEPFINLLIELNSAAGRLLREYTVLLDPAEMPLTPQVPVTQNDAVKAGTDESARASTEGMANTRSVVSSVRQQSADDWNEASYGPVVSGDNLTRIARQITPDGIDLNQMLVALYRANRDAFIEKNMNLLRIGAVLRIPEQQEIASISPKEAVREVRTQTADWHSYRQRVADMANGIVSSQSQQSASGKITSVTDEATSAEGAISQEVLRLSKGELLQDKQPTNAEVAKGSSQQHMQMMEEDAIAKERALREANERVAQLEQNVNRLQRLLQLKDEGLESAQLGQLSKSVLTPAEPASIPSAEAPSAPADEYAGQDFARDSSVMPEFTIPAQPVTDPIPATILQPDLTDPDEFAWLDALIDFATENVMLIGGALAVLLATWLGISMFHRRQEQAEIDAYDDIGNYEVIEPGSASASEISGTRTENDVPGQSDFDRETEKSGVEGTSPNPAFFFGRKLDESPSTEEVSTAGSAQTSSEDSIELSRIFQEEIKIETDSDSDERDEGSKQSADIMAEKAIDTWRSPSSETRETEEHVEKNIFDEDALVDEPAASKDSHEIDFESNYADHAEQAGHKSVNLDEKFARIDLNFGDESAATPASKNFVEAGSDHWQEVSTKIDLAKAYLEMEDRDGAREILQEVLQEGDAEQQETARTMLSEIGD